MNLTGKERRRTFRLNQGITVLNKLDDEVENELFVISDFIRLSFTIRFIIQPLAQYKCVTA